MKLLTAVLVSLFAFNNPIFSNADAAENFFGNISVSSSGKFIFSSPGIGSRANSENGVFWCKYDVGVVSDEVRELLKFQLYEGNRLLFALDRAPGSDLYISNSGITAFMDTRFHFRNELTIHFHSPTGESLFSETFKGASLFGFSDEGNKFGVGTPAHLFIISIPNHQIETYPPADQFDYSEDKNYLAISYGGMVRIFRDGQLVREIDTGLEYVRKIKVSSESHSVIIIDKNRLKAYSITNGGLLYEDSLEGGSSFRDLIIDGNKIITGIHCRDADLSKGIMRVYDANGKVVMARDGLAKKMKTFDRSELKKTSPTGYDPIPWPFFPFDSMRTVWNHYEQHMSYGEADWSYLHQGLDIITPIEEPVYAVAPGIVKCVLTLGGDEYWRLAISPEQSSGWSKGWLYAHLIESSIQVDVGDSVAIHDYLGDIIYWAEDWGHIHFVEIEDSGSVWRYDDNEWGIVYNPLLSLVPDTDLNPPVIENVFGWSKFAFCRNETSNYLQPDSLYGDIDIIVKVSDYIGDSGWEQPAFCSYYWVLAIPEGDTILARTMGHILNHPYSFYGTEYYEPYATLLYKRDNILLPPSWMDMNRNYYHIITNNNGDSLAELSEKALAFLTADYPDGDYRIFIQVYDEYGNFDIDSMDVQFKNGNVGVEDGHMVIPVDFQLGQNHPNPFNSSTIIPFKLASPGKLQIFDIAGKMIFSEDVSGEGDCNWEGIDSQGSPVSSGIYFYKIDDIDAKLVRRMTLVK